MAQQARAQQSSGTPKGRGNARALKRQTATATSDGSQQARGQMQQVGTCDRSADTDIAFWSHASRPIMLLASLSTI